MGLESIATNEFDYNILINSLSDYSFPRNRIQKLLKSGELLRVKKGLYVKSQGSYSLAVLANMIYGPSYLSQHYALSSYGLIPERVYMLTSMTSGRHKQFDTPLGTFTYEPLPSTLYALGLRIIEVNPYQVYVMASPEKALVDIIWKRKDLSSRDALEQYLIHDLRFDLSHTDKFSISRMRILEKAYKKKVVTVLREILEAQKQDD